MMCDWTMSDQAVTISVQEPGLPSMAGHVAANVHQCALKHIMLMHQHASFPLVADASTEHITGDVRQTRTAVAVPYCRDRP